MQYYSQYGLQDSDNHKDLYKNLSKWRQDIIIRPHVSLTISVGDPYEGPGDLYNFLADPFKVSKLIGDGLSTNGVMISSSGVILGPANDQASQEIENLSGLRETPALGTIAFPKFRQADIIPFSYLDKDVAKAVETVKQDMKADNKLDFDQAMLNHLLGTKGRDILRLFKYTKYLKAIHI